MANSAFSGQSPPCLCPGRTSAHCGHCFGIRSENASVVGCDVNVAAAEATVEMVRAQGGAMISLQPCHLNERPSVRHWSIPACASAGGSTCCSTTPRWRISTIDSCIRNVLYSGWEVSHAPSRKSSGTRATAFASCRIVGSRSSPRGSSADGRCGSAQRAAVESGLPKARAPGDRGAARVRASTQIVPVPDPSLGGRVVARSAGGRISPDLWTCPRVAQLIAQRFRIRYHVDHLGRLLHALGWSPQKPARRAVERDEEAIQGWVKQTWPALKKKPIG